MVRKFRFAALVGLLGILASGLLEFGNGPAIRADQVAATAKATGGDDQERAADREAIRQTAREFADAFAKGDAKAAAAHWATQGEYQDEGEVLRGRAAIERAFNAHFKEQPKGKIDVRIESIRFPSRDCAIEEGTLRQGGDGKELPSSTEYRTIHVREDGRWLIAFAREWGADQDRLDDLEWLVGTWTGSVSGRQVTLSFERDERHASIVGHSTTSADGKAVASGMMRIGIDPQRGQLRSWSFHPDGGHGQAFWLRDGNSWVMDGMGVEGNGIEHATVNVLTRINNNEFTWRSVDRAVGDEELPNTAPVKMVRASVSK